MNTKRHYLISDDLDDLELLEEQLESGGVSTPQIHVLSLDDANVAKHKHLHEVQSLMKSDVVHATTRAAMFGLAGAILVLLVAYFAGWTDTPVGWLPFIFLSVIVLGFVTWEGGLFGIQQPNHNFARFESILKQGKHIFFVDLEAEQEPILTRVLAAHPRIERAGSGSSSPHWLISFQQRFFTVRHS